MGNEDNTTTIPLLYPSGSKNLLTYTTIPLTHIVKRKKKKKLKNVGTKKKLKTKGVKKKLKSEEAKKKLKERKREYEERKRKDEIEFQLQKLRLEAQESSNGHLYATTAHVNQLKARKSWSGEYDNSSGNYDDEPEMKDPNEL
ncbi:hypothetical protein AVEN_69020-1 [Araneus ventricosus]|uniref:Uncharacterized protein n=1 Tax=Araneus ventricosus TaxID=182803 RepID=A0A4Y2KXK5_ARAVE|nr:hypothetical protein AVEN_69020-1 [Araneus ventricosus]